MSKLAVAQIETGDALTPLTITTGNATSGFIKVESANSNIVFTGDVIINGGPALTTGRAIAMAIVFG